LYIVETIGYAASIFVILSLMMTKIVRLRLVNLLGALCFVLYGLFLPALPIVLTNAAIIVVNVVQLIKLRKKAYGRKATWIASEDSSTNNDDPR